MSIDSNTLLSLLGSSIKPVVTGASGTAAAGATDAFEALLERARAGELTSSLPVAVEPGVDATLSSDELNAIAVIADQAAAKGAKTVALIRGDDVLTLDVDARRVTAVEPLGSGLSSGADLVTRLPGTFEQVLALPGTVLSHSPDQFDAGRGSVNINSSLLDLLGRSAG